MVETFSNFSITSFSDLSFIGGTFKELCFDVYDSGGNLKDVSTFTLTWLLSPFGQPAVISLSKSGVLDTSVTTNSRFKVTLFSGDTENLIGKYVQQPVLVGADGYEYRLAQGYITIIPAVGISG
jgi:hypothetical protein